MKKLLLILILFYGTVESQSIRPAAIGSKSTGGDTLFIVPTNLKIALDRVFNLTDTLAAINTRIDNIVLSGVDSTVYSTITNVSLNYLPITAIIELTPESPSTRYYYYPYDAGDGISATIFPHTLDSLGFFPKTNKVIYLNNSGHLIQLALGADGTYLKSNGLTSAPSWGTPSGSGGAMTKGEIDDTLGVDDVTTTQFYSKAGTWMTPAGGGDVAKTDSGIVFVDFTQLDEKKDKSDTTASTGYATQSDLSVGLGLKKDASDTTASTGYATQSDLSTAVNLKKDISDTTASTGYATQSDLSIAIATRQVSGSYQPLDADLTTISTAAGWRMFYTNGSGATTTFNLGAQNYVLRSAGLSLAPVWDIDSSGTYKDGIHDGLLSSLQDSLDAHTDTLQAHDTRFRTKADTSSILQSSLTANHFAGYNGTSIINFALKGDITDSDTLFSLDAARDSCQALRDLAQTYGGHADSADIAAEAWEVKNKPIVPFDTLGMVIYGNDNVVYLNSTKDTLKVKSSSGVGETNTMSNLAGLGVGVYKQKSATNFEIKRIQGEGYINITDGTDSVIVVPDTSATGLATKYDIRELTSLLPLDTTGAFRPSEIYLPIEKDTIKFRTGVIAFFGCGADSGNTTTTDKFCMGSQPFGVVVDSVRFTFFSGSGPNMDATISYGKDINAAGTSFGDFTAVTASITVAVPSATIVPESNDVWICWTTITTKPKRWTAVVWGHREE